MPPTAQVVLPPRPATMDDVASLKAELLYEVSKVSLSSESLIQARGSDISMGWLVICGALVVLMHVGLAMLQAGAVSRKNVQNVLFKNIMSSGCSVLCWWLLGYGFAFGVTQEGFIGKDNFGSNLIWNGAGGPGGRDGWESWFFQWTLASLACCIVVGSVAERCKIEALFISTLFLATFTYPIIAHWVWGHGYLSAFGARPDHNGNPRPIFSLSQDSNGVIDFAGSGVVHCVGGFTGLMGTLILGPRLGRFDYVTGVNSMPGHNAGLMALGTGLMWVGWYGFNCGATLGLADKGNLASKVAFNTTISAGAAAVFGSWLVRLGQGHWDLPLALNCILAGLAGISAPCAVVSPWMAFLIGLSSCIWYYLAHHAFRWLRIDDPLDACPVHGVCGAWGLLCVGIFCTDNNVRWAGYPNVNNACGRGEQFGVQIVAILCIVGWTVVNTGLIFLGLRFSIGLRVSKEVETAGDVTEHDAGSTNLGMSQEPSAVFPNQSTAPANALQTRYSADNTASQMYPMTVALRGSPPPLRGSPPPQGAAPPPYLGSSVPQGSPKPSYGGGSPKLQTSTPIVQSGYPQQSLYHVPNQFLEVSGAC